MRRLLQIFDPLRTFMVEAKVREIFDYRGKIFMFLRKDWSQTQILRLQNYTLAQGECRRYNAH